MQRRDGLLVALKDFQVSHLLLTPTVARTVADRDQLSSLQVLALVGEKPTPMDIEIWAGRVRLLNGYGPAECSILSTIHNGITRHDPAGKIGFPGGCKCWIVDPNNHERLLPIGAPGELLIEGHLVDRGYLNDEARTAAVFIKPPQWLLAVRHGVETKVYRTGDIAKYDTDGSIIYLHRKDSQVKLRGQRFELSEVEHHVQRNFPGPTNVVAEVVERQRQRTLFAFILSNEDNAREATAGDSDSRLFHGATEAFTVAVTAVEAQIRQSLPNFMIPATFIPLVRMPYTTSGKTDRHRLWDEAAALSSHQLLTYRRRNAAGQSRTPSTQAERALQAIWADVLGLPASNTKADDTFFNLRGDSIIAIKVASFARATGLHITVADIFDHPPLCDLAEFGLQNSLKGAREVTPFSLSLIQYPEQYLHQLKLLGLTPGSSEIIDLLPGTHIQNFFNQRQTLHYYTFQLAGDVDEQRLQAATAAVMDGKAQHSPYHVYRPSGRSASSDLARAPNSVSAYLWHQRPCRLQPGIVGSRSDGE
jgi:hypothetical protein